MQTVWLKTHILGKFRVKIEILSNLSEICSSVSELPVILLEICSVCLNFLPDVYF